MRIFAYNVGFGDCFAIDAPEREETLLVDFGSDTPEVLDQVKQEICVDFPERKFDVLLTHFHKDHANGFWKTDLTNQIGIRNVYIPDVFAMRNTTTKLDFLQLQVLSDLFAAIVWNDEGISLLNLLQTMAGWNMRGARYSLLHKGNSVPFAGEELRVLWPDFERVKIDKRVEDSMILLLHRMEILDSSDSSENRGTERIAVRYVDDFIDSALRIFRALLEGGGEELLEELEESARTMTNYFREELHISQEIKEEMKNRLSAFRAQANKLSIVFQDRPENGRSRFLMTGDVDVSSLKKIIADECTAKEFQAIKAPHHGTKTHYTEMLPKCEHILISNGMPASGHQCRGEIHYPYGGFYGSHLGCKIHCTSKRCELLKKGFKCSKNCMKEGKIELELEG